MTKRGVLICVLGTFIGFFFMPPVQASNTRTDLGFVRENIWYSKDPFFAGEKIRIHSAVFNSSPHAFSGVVEFYDNGALIGSREFAVQGEGSMSDVSVEWIAGEGDHVISAKMAQAYIEQGSMRREIGVANTETGKRSAYVDRDTDVDGIGDKTDDDDDGDGILDADEALVGTDPLSNDTDGDGLGDKADEDPLQPLPLPEAPAGESGTAPVYPAGAKNIVELVKDTARNALDKVNQLADSGHAGLLEKKKEIEEGLSSPKQAAPQDIATIDIPVTGKKVNIELANGAEEGGLGTAKKTAQKAYLALVSLAAYILENKVLFYAFIAGMVFVTIRFLQSRLGGGGD